MSNMTNILTCIRVDGQGGRRLVGSTQRSGANHAKPIQIDAIRFAITYHVLPPSVGGAGGCMWQTCGMCAM